MIKESTLSTLYLIIISIALCLPTSVFATGMSVAQKQPTKDDIAYLKQDAPVFEITILSYEQSSTNKIRYYFLMNIKLSPTIILRSHLSEQQLVSHLIFTHLQY